MFAPESGLSGREVFSLAQGPDDVIWAGTEHGLFSCRGERWERHAGSPDDLVLALGVDAQGTIWCGTFRSGLIAFPPGSAARVCSQGAPLPDTIYSCLAVGPDGAVWAGTPDGLIRYDGKNWTLYHRGNSGLPSNWVRCLAVAKDGRVWIGTESGVTCFDPSRSAQIR